MYNFKPGYTLGDTLRKIVATETIGTICIYRDGFPDLHMEYNSLGTSIDLSDDLDVAFVTHVIDMVHDMTGKVEWEILVTPPVNDEKDIQDDHTAQKESKIEMIMWKDGRYSYFTNVTNKHPDLIGEEVFYIFSCEAGEVMANISDIMYFGPKIRILGGIKNETK